MLPTDDPDRVMNVARRLTVSARAMPEAAAVVEPLGYDRRGKRQYRQVTFRQLDDQTDRIAGGLAAMGVTPGTRLALLVPPGIDFIALVFGLFKARAVAILIDPGMGRGNLVRCLAEAQPQGFVAIPLVQAVRMFLRYRFPQARFNVTVGRRWFWGGRTLAELRAAPPLQSQGRSDDPAAIIFTTGSTGPPKGVLYSHANFDAQVDAIRDFYAVRPGEVDLPGFPLFGLFNCAMGVTTVIPDMDPSRPAQVDPAKIVEAIGDWQVTQAFGSPAIWNRVGRYCQDRGIRLPSVRRILSAGAPVPAEVLERMKSCIHPEGEVHTPYGATEALPVASISAAEVLGETAAATRQGEGVCVGRCFPGIRARVIRIVDGPIRSMAEAVELPPREIGELVVRGPVVTRRYVTRGEANLAAKIPDGPDVWHRMGDAGYFDEKGRFWFCGRLAHRVLTPDGPMYPVRCEAVFNRHPKIARSALVGVGRPGHERPVIVLEPRGGQMPSGRRQIAEFLDEVRRLGRSHPLTAAIGDFLIHPAFPVDIRHNVKIFREKLAVWAALKLRASTRAPFSRVP
ncbi:MAG: fatty acid CoA ligase family protein [Thermoguttaceae bacterium]|jgi:acyl-CoA synthetase (AMP-forming)/AMP-acid ligase II